MSSKYLEWKYRDVQPEEKEAPLTGKAKWKNWFYYHKFYLLTGALLLLALLDILYNALGIGQTKPDYILAYVGDRELPEGAEEKLTEALSEFGTDLNGDGKVTFELRQYALNPGGDEDTAYYYSYAANITLTADIEEADSYIFLTDDALQLQISYQIFADADGNPPADDDTSVSDKVYLWENCPVLNAMGITELNGLYIGRRCFYKEEQEEALAGDAELWSELTKGAVR